MPTQPQGVLLQCSWCKGSGKLYEGIVTKNIYDKYSAERYNVLGNCRTIECPTCKGEGIQEMLFI